MRYWLARAANGLALLCLFAVTCGSPAAAQVLWEDFRGDSDIEGNSGQIDPGPRYSNYDGVPLQNLRIFARDSANAARNGASSDIDYGIMDGALCNTNEVDPEGTLPACAADVMGRVLWARVQFPQAGSYSFSVAHDDDVDVDISRDFRNPNYKGLNYDLPVGALNSYTDDEDDFEPISADIRAPMANSCAWIRIHWNNYGGRNFLRLQWTRPDNVTEIIPASAYISPTGTPSSAVCGAAVGVSATSLRLIKTLGPLGRKAPNDQFTIYVEDAAFGIVDQDTSAGSTVGDIADSGTVAVPEGEVYYLSELMADDSAVMPSDYRQTISCTRDGVAFTPAKYDADRWMVTSVRNQEILCRLHNDRVLVAPVAQDDPSSGHAVAAPVTVSVLDNDDSGSPPVMNSVVLLRDGMPAGAFLAPGGKLLSVPGQGVWTVNDGTGAVTFTPASGYLGDPTPVFYQMRDADNQLSNKARITLTFVQRSDLSITKSVSKATPLINEEVTFTLRVRNDGPSPATGVTVTDQLASGYVYVSHSGGIYLPGPGTWTVGNLPSSGTAELQIVARVAPSGDYTNTASVVGQEADPLPGNNSVAISTTPQTTADLSVVATVDVPLPTIGDRVVFTLTVQNAGPGAASNVRVDDLLPAGYTFVTSSAPGAYVPATGVWTIGALANGASAVLLIEADVTATGPYLNTARVSATEVDPVPGNNVSTVAPGPLPRADLRLVKTASSMTPAVGSTVVFTLDVFNLGLSSASNTLVTDKLPSGYSYVSDSGGGSYDSASGIWTIGTLAALQGRSLQVTATVLAQGVFTNTAQVQADEPDTDFLNNLSSVTPVPVPRADLEIAMVVDNATPAVGEIVTFTLTAHNRGPSDATGVKVPDLLRTGYSYVSSEGAGSYDPATGLWDIGALANGGTATLSLRARVNGTGPYGTTATIRATTIDPDLGNNSATQTPVPQPRADLALLKTVSSATPRVGDTVTFVLAVTNTGPSAATNVLVTDQLPLGFTYVSNNRGFDYNPGSGIWVVGTLENGQRAELQIVALVKETGPWTNTALTTSAVTDPDVQNNTGVLTVAPVQVADLGVQKTADIPSPNLGELVTFTLTASNAGPSAASGVTVLDRLPSGYAYQSDNGGGAYEDGTGLWTIGALASGDSRQLQIMARAQTGSSYRNSARIQGAQLDPNAANDSAAVAAGVGAQADLYVRNMLAGDMAPLVGDQVQLSLVVGNGGPSGATQVELLAPLPSGYSYVGHTGPGSFDPATGLWTLPDLGMLAEHSLTVTVKVLQGGDHAYRATVQGLEADPDALNNQAVVAPVPRSVADLAVEKQSSDATPGAGSEITFTLTARNAGPSDATGVRVTDNLPPGYSYLSHSGGQYEPVSGVWAVDDLAAGTSRSLQMKVRVKATGPWDNSATVTGDQHDPNLIDNDRTVTSIATPQADLGVTMTVSPLTSHVGDNVVFTLVAHNNGPSAATGVTVQDPLPAGFTFVGSSLPPAYDAGGVWTIGTLANGASATLEITATVTSTGAYTNTARISGLEADPVSSNDTASLTLTPLPRADLTATISSSAATPYFGDEVTFSIDVRNLGPSTATGVRVNAPLPSGFTFLGLVSGPGTYSPGTGLWTLGTLTPAGTPQLVIRARVNPSGDYAYSVTVTGLEDDPALPNNTSSTVLVPAAVPSADLAVSQAASSMTPAIGAPMTFTVTVRNNGPSAATGVVVQDLLPAGYTLTGNNPSIGSYVPLTGAWTLGPLANGASATLVLTATVNTTGPYDTTAVVTGNEADPAPGNNSSSLTPVPVVAPLADLAVSQVASSMTPVIGAPMTFTVTVRNNGSSAATGVVVQDLLPAGYTLTGNDPSIGSYVPLTGAWTLGPLANGASATLVLTATVNTTGPYDTTAVVTGNEADPAPGNNSSSLTPVPVVAPLADLAVSQVASSMAPAIGAPMTFTVTVTNNGPSAATGVVVQDLLPAGYMLTGNTPSTGSYNAGSGAWTLGPLANGASATLVLTATVNASGPYDTTAVVTGTEADPAPGNNSSSLTPVPVVAPLADLAVSQVASSMVPVIGAPMTFTVTVTNNGPSAATGVVVQDLLPVGYTLTGNTPSTGSYNAGSGAWTLGPLANGASATLVLTATVNASGPYDTTAVVTGTEADPAPGNNSISLTPVPVVAPLADLAVSQVASSMVPVIGAPMTFMVTVRNNGPSAATGVVVQDLLPAGYTLTGNDPSIGSYVPLTGAWTLGPLANGASATLVLTATVNTTGPYDTTAVVTGSEADPDLSNNTSSLTPVPVVAPLADLAVSQVASTMAPVIGTSMSFTVTVTNHGPDDATGVVLQDLLPAGYTLTGNTPSTGSYNAGSGAWTLGPLANGASATLVLTATVNASGPYDTTAVVSGGEADPDLSNNTSSLTPVPVVAPLADLGLVKSVDTSDPSIGTEVTFTLNLQNAGPSAASGVEVLDLLPAGYSYVSDSGAGAYQPGSGIWTVGTLAKDASISLAIVARVEASGPYVNSASVTATETDPVPGNETSSVTPVPVARADLSLAKTVDVAEPNVGDEVTFTLSLQNAGPSAASGVEVLDLLPSGYSYVSDDGGGSYRAATGIWSLGDIAQGASRSLAIRVKINETGEYRNQARVSGREPDPDPSNDLAEITPLVGRPVLAVRKTADLTEITAPGPITYQITVQNTGTGYVPRAALQVEDELTVGARTVSLTPVYLDGDAAGDDRLSAGEAWRYQVIYPVTQAEIDREDLIENLATVRAGTLSGVVSAPVVAVAVVRRPVALELVKLAGVETAMIGDLVPYTIRVSNPGLATAQARIEDLLPAGFRYRRGSAKLDGLPVSPEETSRRLALGPVTLAPGQSRALTFDLYVGSGVMPGRHINRALVVDPLSRVALAAPVEAAVRVLADPVFQCATVIGRVFDDRDQDGHMDVGGQEAGLPAVRLVSPTGVEITTDQHGRFNVPCAALPRAYGSNFMLKLDPRSLPSGYQLTTENPRVVRLTPGMLTRIDFGATLARLARVDVSARAYRDGKMRPELEQGLRVLAAGIDEEASLLRLTYVLEPRESEETARHRLQELEQALQALWDGLGRRKLPVETVIERRRAVE